MIPTQHTHTHMHSIIYCRNGDVCVCVCVELGTDHVLTRGISIALRVRPDLRSNGRGAHNNPIPLAVLSVYKGTSLRNGST